MIPVDNHLQIRPQQIGAKLNCHLASDFDGEVQFVRYILVF